jgi:integrase
MALAEWEWWTVNPISGLTPPSFKKTDPPSSADAASIVNEAFRRELAWDVFVSMMTGARRGEVVALRRRHHDPAKKGIKNDFARHIVLDEATSQLFVGYWATLDAAAHEAGRRVQLRLAALDDQQVLRLLRPGPGRTRRGWLIESSHG